MKKLRVGRIELARCKRHILNSKACILLLMKAQAFVSKGDEATAFCKVLLQIMPAFVGTDN